MAYRCLDHVGLLDRIWQRADTLSGGEQQRVAIAKILAQEPALVLGDEPVASLDPMNGALVMATLRDVATRAARFLRGYLHPSFAHVGEYAWQCVVTVCIALWGTLLAVVIAIPLGLLGARNLAPHPVIYVVARRAMDLLRAVNEFVFALMFVTAVGLGPFAGMLALGLHTGGVLGKLLSEAVESIDAAQVEGVSAAGATRLQTIVFGVVPSSKKTWA